MAAPRYRFDAFIFDPADGRLEHAADGRAMNLRPQVAQFLLALLLSPRAVIDRDSLRRIVWGEHAVVDFESGLAAIVRELRQALDQLGGRAQLLETIPRRGYRLAAEVAELAADVSAPAPAPVPASEKPPAAPRRLRRAPAVALLGAVVMMSGLALLAAAVAWWSKPGTGVEAPPGQALAVLPFDYYGGGQPAGRQLGVLLADTLLAALWEASLPDVVLIGRASLLPYQGRDDVAASAAADLGVRLLIEGSVVRDGEDWQLAARMLRMPGGEVLWSDTLLWQDRRELPVRESAELLAESLARTWARDHADTGESASRD